MAGAPGYTVDEARADAREWIKGTTLHGGSRGWRVCCAILDERIAELEAALAGHRDRLMAANESGMRLRRIERDIATKLSVTFGSAARRRANGVSHSAARSGRPRDVILAGPKNRGTEG